MTVGENAGMAKPQQPELHRSGRGATDPNSAKTKAASAPPPATDGPGPVPADNRPGRRPKTDQDKPAGPPRKRRAPARAAAKTRAASPRPATRAPERRRFGFAFDPRVAPFSLAVGVTARTAYVEVADGELLARFGPWVVQVPLDEVDGAEVTGPYQWLKVAGPAHLSFADRGLTFATTTERGVCIRFKRPVRGIEPFGVLRHPGLTVTVEDVDGLVQVLESARR